MRRYIFTLDGKTCRVTAHQVLISDTPPTSAELASADAETPEIIARVRGWLESMVVTGKAEAARLREFLNAARVGCLRCSGTGALRCSLDHDHPCGSCAGSGESWGPRIVAGVMIDPGLVELLGVEGDLELGYAPLEVAFDHRQDPPRRVAGQKLLALRGRGWTLLQVNLIDDDETRAEPPSFEAA